MRPEELKKLEAEQKKAMEALNAFNKEARGAVDLGKDMLGLK